MTSNNAQAPTGRHANTPQTQKDARSRRRITTDWAATANQSSIPPRKGLHAEYFPVYKIDWPKLQRWMERRFPDEEFKRELIRTRTMTKDNYVCWTPNVLTPAEKTDIQDICKIQLEVSGRARGQD